MPARCPTKLALGTMNDVRTKDSKGAYETGSETRPQRLSDTDGCCTDRIVIHPNTTHEYPTPVTCRYRSILCTDTGRQEEALRKGGTYK